MDRLRCLHYICQWFCDSPKWFWYPVFHRERLGCDSLVLQSLVCCAIRAVTWQLKLRPRLGGHESEGKMRVEKSQCFAVVMLKTETIGDLEIVGCILQ